MLAGLNAGVAAVASAHCRDIPSLLRRPCVRMALDSGAFDCVVALDGRKSPGVWRRIYETGSCMIIKVIGLLLLVAAGAFLGFSAAAGV